MNKVLTDNKEMSKFEKGLRKWLRIHPWVPMEQGRKEISMKVIQTVGLLIVGIILLKILNFI